MSVKVLTASSVSELISLADAKRRLGISASTWDSLLSALIDDASSTIASALGRPLGRQRYLETLSGNDRTRILLSRFPVDRDSVTLEIDDTAQTDFTVEDPAVGMLYREGLWPIGASEPNERPEESVEVTYKAGYVLPDQIAAWANSAAVSALTWVRPTTPVGDLLMECTTAGTTDSSEPTWPTTAGTTVTSGTAVYTARHAEELPKAISSVAWLVVRRGYTASKFLTGTRELESDGQRIVFQASDQNEAGLTAIELSALGPFMVAA